MGKLFIAIIMGCLLMLALAITFSKVSVQPIWSVGATAIAGGLIGFVSSRYLACPKSGRKSMCNL